MKQKADMVFYKDSVRWDKTVAQFFKGMGATYIKYWEGDKKNKFRLYGKQKKENGFYKISPDGQQMAATALINDLKALNLYKKDMTVDVKLHPGSSELGFIELIFDNIPSAPTTSKTFKKFPTIKMSKSEIHAKEQLEKTKLVDLMDTQMELDVKSETIYLCSVPSMVTKDFIFKDSNINDVINNPKLRSFGTIQNVEMCSKGVKVTYEELSTNTIKVKQSEFSSKVEGWVKQGIKWDILGNE